MKNFKRTVLVGFVWGLIFFLWWLKGFLYQNWNFDIFSRHSWGYLYNEFVSGWVVSATSDWIFIWTLLLAIPLFLIGWSLFLKINWRQSIGNMFKKMLYFFRQKTATVSKKKFKYAPKKGHQKVRPQPLYTSVRALKNAKQAPEPAKTLAKNTAKEEPKPSNNPFDFSSKLQRPAIETKPSASSANPMPSFLEEDDFSNISLDDIQLPTRTALNENISDILLKKGYKVVSDVVLDNIKCNFIAIDSSYIFVLSADMEKGDWLADEERFNGEDPLWFSESSHRVSPVFHLIQLAEDLTKRLRVKGIMQTVKPVLIEQMGNIINAEDMQKIWQEKEVLVLRTDIGGPEELASVEMGMPDATGSVSDIDLETIRSAF